VKEENNAQVIIRTIGHSTRSLEEFTGLLKKYEITVVVDVRTVPRSRKNPQFNRETLPEALEREKIAYRHMAGLGGLRHPAKDSPNAGWRNASFRGYADYMQTEEFRQNLEELISLARSERIVLMCAEALPWRCHRSLIADALTIRGIRTKHIMSTTSHNPHRLTPWARVEGLKITYPGESVPDTDKNGAD
jgi:uncharacterized protein (DUF488 family)